MPRVYIGAGHGGSDPGAVSGRHIEKNYALDIASACTAELRIRGVEVMQSRTSDITESAAAKIAECNKFNPDLAADIHLNAGGGDGFEVYCSVSGEEGRRLAAAVESAVIAETGQNSRGIKTRKNSRGRDYFGFIRQTECPALLVECAFIDSADVQAVDTLAERQSMGKAIAHGILDYLGIAVNAEKFSGGAAAVRPPETAVLLPQLGRGLDGPEYQVKRVQLCLNEMGYTGADGKPLTVDGDFGANTEMAIRKLQATHGIRADGRMTAETWRALLVFRR